MLVRAVVGRRKWVALLLQAVELTLCPCERKLERRSLVWCAAVGISSRAVVPEWPFWLGSRRFGRTVGPLNLTAGAGRLMAGVMCSGGHTIKGSCARMAG